MCPSVFWKMNWTIRESAGKIEQKEIYWQGAGLERSKSMAEEKKGFFRRLVDGLTKTRDNIVSGMDSILTVYTY